jgi:hypothetical protein
VKQATAHERDAAANRFTRHEVKNGLLSAIGLVDSLQELCVSPAAHAAGGAAPGSPGGCPGGPGNSPRGDPGARGARYVGELQTTLTETLNSVLSETMAREVRWVH